MKNRRSSEKLLIQEVSEMAKQLHRATKGMSIGVLIKILREQLGMPQRVLAQKARVPQPTISRLEQNKGNPSLETLNKVLEALSSDILVVPLLRESVDTVRRKQAKRVAKRHIEYIKGTMNLEKQEPDSRFLKELLRSEEEELLFHSGSKLWEEWDEN